MPHQKPKVQEGLPGHPELADHEGQRYEATGDKEAIDQAAIGPVEAVALVESGIEEAETKPRISQAGSIEMA
jgi:hypothetical protein